VTERSTQTATLDRLSGGRLTLGVDLGSDWSGNELSITGEERDDRRRAGMLDEALEVLTAAWSGEPVYHRGEHYTVDGMRFLPRPVRRPGVPVWGGAGTGESGIRFGVPSGSRGFFPVDLEQSSAAAATRRPPNEQGSGAAAPSADPSASPRRRPDGCLRRALLRPRPRRPAEGGPTQPARSAACLDRA
jgi:alkanesulfonate monooxygenase SsuD/methylene tetrahydromethanopterin reductase-like flavin-dependent oxidoreductase (luciferase family)